MNVNSSQTLLTVPTGPLQISDLRPTNNVYFSLVIPTYKERDNIQNVVKILSQTLDEFIPGDYELIVVDDDSPDLTWEVAQSLTQEYPQLRVMRRQQERGLSSAVIRGWQVANGSVLGVIDGDLQHPPEILTQLLSQIAQGADLAVASRHVDGGGVSSWSVVRRFLSRGAQVLGLMILPGVLGRVSDPMSGYFMVRRNSIVGALLNPVGYKILLEVIGRGNVQSIAEVGYVFCERQEGESKVTWKQYVEYIHHLIRLRLSTGRLGRWSQNSSFPIGRFLRFGLVGLSGVFVDMAVLYLLSDPSTLALPLTRSKIIAGEIAIFNNFLWNDAWTFADVSMRQQEWHQRLKRFVKFNIICLAGLVLNVLVLNLVFNFLIPNRYIANLIAIAVATIWNFWVNLKLSWRVTDVK
ncbi:putative membrane protein [Nostoc sp. PCC 7524]|uniref:glycosyltransferase n=1 Tax=Nostoc sp. (strain ATCC 29411 / PCC 7524) TaxID=28072 RepID=UPI00029F06C9|nr:glycosyltransferase [Nostoc sp. PCC 7524]AFY46758.1 putative membrane protein [Nostoc sp. PCC 7524]